MSNVRELHKQAMALVKEANSLDDKATSMKLLKEALTKESEAAMLLYPNFNAEPTRSVLFRSAATIAYNCGDFESCERLMYCGLSGINVPLEIKEELIQIKNELDVVKELGFEANRYLKALRKNAINLRLQPATPKYSEAVFIEDILGVLRNIKISFQNFIEINFLQKFGVDTFGDRTDRIIAGLKKEFPLLYVNSKFASFGASISTDATIMSNDNYPQEIKEWKKNLFDEFKNDVIYLDYQKEKNIEKLTVKYSDKERNSIYKGITEIFSNTRSYKVSFTDETFDNVIKEVNAIPKSFVPKIIPKIEKQESSKTLVRTIGMTSKGNSQINKSDIIMSEELAFAEFKHSLSSVTEGKRSIDFNQNVDLIIVYQNNQFYIDFNPFGINIMESSYDEVLSSFNVQCIEQYFRIMGTNENELDFDSTKIKENFKDYVFATT